MPVLAADGSVLIINDSVTGTDFNQFQFSSGWVHEGGYPALFEGGDEHWTTNAQFGNTLPSFSMKFLGNKIILYGHRTNNGGMADVYIDGEKAGIIDYYRNGRLNKDTLFASELLTNGEHTIEVRLNGQRNENAGTTFEAAIDYAVIESEIEDWPATGIQLNTQAVKLEEGMSHQLSADIQPSYATVVPPLVWSSSDDTIASVDENGLIHASQAGTAVITAALEGTDISASCTVTVRAEDSRFYALIQDENIHHNADSYLSDTEALYGKDLQAQHSASGTVWKNENYLSRIDVLTKSEAWQEGKWVVEDLADEEGHIIDASNVSLTWMHDVTSHSGGGQIFDVITHKTAQPLEAQKLYEAWLNVHIPEDAAPGTYTLNASLLLDGQTADTFTYTITVQDLAMPTDTTQMELWMYPYSAERYYSGQTNDEYFGKSVTDYWNVRFTGEADDALASQLDLYNAIGGDAITVTVVEDPWNHQCWDPYPSMVKWTRKADGTFSYDYTDLDKWVQMNLDHGIDGQIKSFSLSCWGNRVAYYDEAAGKVVSETPATGSDRWNELWRSFLVDYMAHMKEKGWFDITYMAMDERPLSEVTPVLDLVESVCDENGEHFKTSIAIYNWDTESVLDRIDDVSFSINLSSQTKTRQIAQQRKEKGLLTTLYTCGAQNSALHNNPGESTASILECWKAGTQGFLRWALDSFNFEPLDNSYHWNFVPGDLYMIYPSEKDGDRRAQRSPRFEKLIQGIQQMQKLNYLEEAYPEMADSIAGAKDKIGYNIPQSLKVIAQLSDEALHGPIVPEIRFAQSELTLAAGESQELVLKSTPDDLLDSLLQESTVLNDSSSSITWIGEGWAYETGYPDLFEGGDDHWSNSDPSKPGTTGYEFDFTGDSFALIGNLEDVSGILSITIDDRLPVEADTYSPGKIRFATLYQSPSLGYGKHHVKVVNSGKKNASSRSYNMQLDYVAVQKNLKAEFVSSRPEVASAEDGVLHALTPGETVISVTLGEYSASLPVKVEAVQSQAANKVLLEQAVSYAEEAMENGALEGVNTLVANWFEQKLDEARTILADEEASQEEVNAAWTDLIRAVHMLEFRTDFTVLDAAILRAQSLDLSQYREEEKAELQAALEEALAVRDSDTALTEVSIRAAADRLNAAIEALVPAPTLDTSLLSFLVQAVENTDLNLYADTGKEAFTEALAAARAVLEQPESQAQIDAATADLHSAWMALRLRPDESQLEQLRSFVSLCQTVFAMQLDDGLMQQTRTLHQQAQALLDDPQATKQQAEQLLLEIEKLQPVLEKALDVANNKNQTAPEKPGSTVQPAQSAAQSTDKKPASVSASVKTGVASGHWMASLGGAAILAWIASRNRKNRK